MIQYEKFKLENGLTVIFHQDKTTPMAMVNIMYNVGARDEEENRTGFAHLFEHLMFGGSKNIPSYDTPLQNAGGECNAFTSNDITNYYNHLPVQNIETALWLESDRMKELAFTPESLEVQRNVVIEEFKQRYLNQPYGDVWLKFRPVIYTKHPYKWATIGKDISHIEKATLDEVKAFFYKFYAPANAVLVIAGNLELEAVQTLVHKWFDDIPNREKYIRNLPVEPKQTETKRLTLERPVPSSAIYMVFRVGNRISRDHYIGDLASDIIAGSHSSRLYKELIVKEKKFTSISAYISGDMEESLFVISGHVADGVSVEEGEELIWNSLNALKIESINDRELTKVKNKHKTGKVFSEQSILNRVINIAYFETLGCLDQIDLELDKYDRINVEDVKDFVDNKLKLENASILHVIAKK
ncbi:M16 family metallopeptidase [Crocinitomix catalasitica]|uniref:M16 family metallopeptidase n=1 Tax=Crocinitomix catalasitica TaxID=184607 RepID=UPI000482BA96|nr:pitrilysin family protein [Crocinitomix catalasitica]